MPFEYSNVNDSLSLIDWILNIFDNAFTAFVPTPFRPTDFWNTSVSYFPPVMILDTQSAN